MARKGGRRSIAGDLGHLLRRLHFVKYLKNGEDEPHQFLEGRASKKTLKCECSGVFREQGRPV